MNYVRKHFIFLAGGIRTFCRERTVLLKGALISSPWGRNNSQIAQVSSEMREGHCILNKNKFGNFLGEGSRR